MNNNVFRHRWRWIGILGMVVILIGVGAETGAAAAQTSDDARDLFSDNEQSPTWAVDTERYRQEPASRKRPVPASGWSDRIIIALIAGLVVLHLLVSVVVFLDLRRSPRKMSGLWIWIVFLGGVPAAIAYALFRRNRLLERHEEGAPENDSTEEG